MASWVMPEYAITFARSARRELERLEVSVIGRILSQVEALGHAPRPSGCQKLRGRVDLWRVRVGDYRVIYEIDDSLPAVDIVAIRHRREAYR